MSLPSSSLPLSPRKSAETTEAGNRFCYSASEKWPALQGTGRDPTNQDTRRGPGEEGSGW